MGKVSQEPLKYHKLHESVKEPYFATKGSDVRQAIRELLVQTTYV